MVACVVRRVGGKTPAQVDSPRPEFNVSNFVSQMESVTRNARPRLKARRLLRDGSRCVLSGFPIGVPMYSMDAQLSVKI